MSEHPANRHRHQHKKAAFRQGFVMALPISLGYLAVSFTLGLAASKAGMSVIQAVFMSLITNTSAGQFAGIAAIGAGSPLLPTAVAQLVINLRYVLMSSGLTQVIDRDAPARQRLLVAFDITDELFALGVRQTAPLSPFFYYGMMAATIPCWALGTGLGAALGALLPPILLNAANVMLYGMFLASVLPGARSSRPLLYAVVSAMTASALFSLVPPLSSLSGGLRVAILALSLSAFFAWCFPIREEGQDG